MEIEFVSFIGKDLIYPYKPYIKDIRMRFSTFPSVYVDKSLCNNSCQKIESAEFVTLKQPMRKKELVVLTNYQSSECLYFTHEKTENLCLYLDRKKAENLSICPFEITIFYNLALVFSPFQI